MPAREAAGSVSDAPEEASTNKSHTSGHGVAQLKTIVSSWLAQPGVYEVVDRNVQFKAGEIDVVADRNG